MDLRKLSKDVVVWQTEFHLHELTVEEIVETGTMQCEDSESY